MEFTFVCMSKEAVNMESVEYFPYMCLLLRDVGVDEDVIQVNDDNDNNIHKDVVHELLKS